MDEKLCNERHKAIEGELHRHSSWLGDHEKKIDKLERSDATNTTQIENLTKAIGSQTKAIWAFAGTVFAALLGFFIWYVQNLTR